MAAQMVVIYRRPPNEAAFRKHYFDVHVPLAKQLPGLLSYETSVGPVATVVGDKDTYFVAVLRFESLAAIQAAFATECGRACARDRRELAPNDDDVQMFLYDTETL